MERVFKLPMFGYTVDAGFMDKTLTDEEAALLVQKGGKESFGLLVERYEAKITRYGRKFISSPEDIADLVQTVFIKTYENIRSFNGKGKFSSWLYRIAHNEFINGLKKKGRLQFLPFYLDALFPHPFAQETADEKTNREETVKLLSQSLGKLHLKYREPLVLFYFEELSYREIADVLQIPITTVGVRILRGKTALRKIYEQINNR